MTRYVLLCRHGKHRRGQLISVKLEDGTVECPIEVVGQRLREQLATANPPGRDAMRLAAVLCADTPEARETLGCLLRSLGWDLRGEDGPARCSDGQRSIAVGSPDELSPNAAIDQASIDEFARKVREAAASTSGNTTLVVGHQPLLSRLADSLLRPPERWRPRRAPVPVDHAGVVCVGFEHDDRIRTWLVWAISYDDTAAADQVREKIVRKMESAKLLGGLLTVGLSVLFGVLFDQGKLDALGPRRWAVQLGTTLFLLAAVLYLATMYAYDTLLMPQRFWGESQAGRRSHQRRRRWLVERPPSSSAWILYQNMMRIWLNQFTVASGLMVAGAALLGYAALRFSGWALLGIGLPVAALLLWWLWWSRPVLGSED